MVKYRTKDFSKAAWSSRVTAPLIKVDLTIQCRDLPKKDLLSQADAFCVLWQIPNGYTPNTVNGMPSKLPTRQEIEKGFAKPVKACVDPVFKDIFRLEYSFHEEQTYIIRVYDEDLKFATALKEHDYLGGCVFTLGQLMGAKGCTIAKRLARDKSYMIITGNEIIDTREVLEFRFSCQDLIKEQNIIDQSKVLDKSNPYFRLARFDRDDQKWEVIWKSEVIKDSLNPTWMEARLPLQLLCNDDQSNSLRITIWDYEKHSSQHDKMGYVETTVAEVVSKAKEGISVFKVMRDKKKLFGGTKLKCVGLLKVIKASVITIPSMLQYLGGSCSLDLMIAIDCSVANGEFRSEKSLHYSASHWLNDYQAGIQKLGAICENFARGRHSSMWALGAKIKGEYKDKYIMAEKLIGGKELLGAYDKEIVENSDFELGEPFLLKPLLQAATFRTIRSSKIRQSYTILCVFTAGDIADLQESVDLICTAAEDAPMSIVIIGVGNRDFSAVEKLTGDDGGLLRDSRGIPIARQIVTFVSFKQFGGNASEVIAESLKEIPEQFVVYHATNGIKPLPQVPPPDFGVAKDKNKSRNGQGSRSRSPADGRNRSRR